MPGNGSSGEIDVILIARFGNAAASASVCCCAAAEPIDSAASGGLSEVPILGCHGVMFMWQRHRRHALRLRTQREAGRHVEGSPTSPHASPLSATQEIPIANIPGRTWNDLVGQGGFSLATAI